MIVFTCKTKDCANAGIAYPMETEDDFAECGGCGTKLKGIRDE
jgi:hypothetical protein